MVSPALYLLDTNIASFVIRGHDARLLRRLRSHAVGAVAISAVTEAELLYGRARKPGATALAAAVDAFLAHVRTLRWDSAAAVRYGHLRAALEAAGTPMGSMDTLIAAHALAADAVLVSNDQAFRRVKGLKVQDWTG
ncbi:MAG TPA: PIN domain-containing protein [Rubrivivax sp.]|nr:PIN domain-containing protein [Rubrivivax sp.]